MNMQTNLTLLSQAGTHSTPKFGWVPFAGFEPETRPHVVRELSNHDFERVAGLLAQNPLYGVHLRGMIEDHGLVHPAQRGQYFGYFVNDRLAGVALLGHAFLLFAELDIEDDALRQFAQLAADTWTEGHVIYGPRLQVETFWQYLAQHGFETRVARTHHWFTCHGARVVPERLQLQLASPAELDQVAITQAEMVIEECGTDPRQKDPQGFHRRVTERIIRERTWVRMKDHQIIFKAELVSETPEVIYLEGIWTHPEYRDGDLTKDCVAELVYRLFLQRQFLSLVAETSDPTEISVYEHAGFVYREDYQARFLKPIS
jgi:predicted GNAT family acetyltransferase